MLMMEVKQMDEWLDAAFKQAWLNYANKTLLDMGLITEQEYQKMAVKLANSLASLQRPSQAGSNCSAKPGGNSPERA